MILYWKGNNHARHLKLGIQVKGIIYKGKRPDVVILTQEEHSSLIHSQDPVSNARGETYLYDLLRVTSTRNVIVAR